MQLSPHYHVNRDDAVSEETLWITRARQGDEQAFLYLLERYQRAVYNLCYRMLGEMENAEDAAQETFLRAYHGLSQYDARRPFVTWLLSIAAHHCIDRLRRQRPLLSLEDEADSQSDFQAIHLADPSQLDPQEAVEQHEQSALVQRLLLHLDPLDRAAIVLRYWYELSEVEIGEQLGLTVSAVKSRLHRSRRRLARLWLQENEPPTLRSLHEPSTV